MVWIASKVVNAFLEMREARNVKCSTHYYRHYRDESVVIDGVAHYYYHGNLIARFDGTHLWVCDCGYATITTRERLAAIVSGYFERVRPPVRYFVRFKPREVTYLESSRYSPLCISITYLDPTVRLSPDGSVEGGELILPFRGTYLTEWFSMKCLKSYGRVACVAEHPVSGEEIYIYKKGITYRVFNKEGRGFILEPTEKYYVMGEEVINEDFMKEFTKSIEVHECRSALWRKWRDKLLSELGREGELTLNTKTLSSEWIFKIERREVEGITYYDVVAVEVMNNGRTRFFYRRFSAVPTLVYRLVKLGKPESASKLLKSSRERPYTFERNLYNEAKDLANLLGEVDDGLP